MGSSQLLVNLHGMIPSFDIPKFGYFWRGTSDGVPERGGIGWTRGTSASSWLAGSTSLPPLLVIHSLPVLTISCCVPRSSALRTQAPLLPLYSQHTISNCSLFILYPFTAFIIAEHAEVYHFLLGITELCNITAK